MKWRRPWEKVTGYVCYFDNDCDPPLMTIQLANDNIRVGTIETTDAAYFSAIIDMLRNEGPHLYWNEALAV